ncbi:hypothetical protein [Ramlibacter sp. AN1133]|uniref:hypothetical protein n=1 Tax=Ramlibacter sp. AN1133 TaxID=3133429 RepID=UPI0030C2C9B4
MMNTTRTSVGARVSDAADEARHFATDAAGRIGETARELRDDAADLARTGVETVSDATAAAQRQLGNYARATRRHVAREPMKSALIAAAIGAAATALVLAIFRNRRDAD